MRDMNRRTAMAAVAAAAVVPTAALAADGPDPVFAAIEANKIAHATLKATCDVVERHDLAWFAQRKKGDRDVPKTMEHDRANAEQERTCDAAQEAMQKLCEIVPATRAGMKAALAYFLSTDYGDDSELCCALLQSISQAVAA
jgi:hypothetical protein